MFVAMVLVLGLAAAAEDLIRPYPQDILRNEVIQFKTIADHHFSVEAPQKCNGKAPVESSARGVTCQFLKSGEGSAILNVCDDKKTFCKPVAVSVKVGEKQSAEPVRLIKNQNLNETLKKDLVPGFQFGHPDEIRKLALAKGQPVFVMISTDWCPPCNEAKEYLLNSPAFVEATKNWFKVYVDGDSLEAADWEKIVPFRYYPSFVLLNSKMREVARFNQEQRILTFVNWAQENERLMNDPIENLKGRVLDRKDERVVRRFLDVLQKKKLEDKRRDEVRLLRWVLDQDDRAVIDKLLASGDAYPEIAASVLQYKIQNAEAADKQNYLKELVDQSFKGENWSAHVDSLCAQDAKVCRDVLKNVNERIQWLQARGELTDSEKFSMMGGEFYYLAQAYEKLKDPVRKQEYALKCVNAYESLKTKSRLKLARGAQQGLISCFELAGQDKKAQDSLKTLIEIYPNEPTFLIRMSRLYRKQKNFVEALRWVERAENVAYGYNWFSLTLIKSEILLDLKRVKEAQGVVDGALSEIQLGVNSDSRNHLVAARLRALQTKIQDRLSQ